MVVEIVSLIVSIAVAVMSVIGYRTRSDIRTFLSTGILLLQSAGELLYDLSIVIKNIKLVEKPVLPGLAPGYTLEFGNDVVAVKSLGDIPNHVKEVLAKLD